MIVLSWNCRGLGQPLAIPTLCELVRVHRPRVIFLFETLAHKNRVEEVRLRLDFQGCFAIDCMGRSGGICALWKEAPSCDLLGYSNNHIDLRVHDTVVGDWRLTGFYGYPERHRRKNSWELLRRLSSMYSLPWAIMGDFNDLLNISDKRGEVDHPNWLFNGFRKAVSNSGLIDLQLIGHQYTWSRRLGTPFSVEERLDRGMVNMACMSLFPNITLRNIHAPISDHSPILLNTEDSFEPRKHRRFRFENKWLKEPDLPNVVRDCWKNLEGINILERLTATSESLMVWAQHIEAEFRRNKRDCERNIERLQSAEDENSIKLLMETKKKLAEILLKEEIYWKQRAKLFWLKEGDKNTRFFHSMASTRRKNNAITKLQREDGSWQRTKLIFRIWLKNITLIYSALVRVRSILIPFCSEFILLLYQI